VSRRTRLAVAALVLATGALAACSRAVYVVRSGLAEARILWRREPIAELLAQPDLDATFRRRLELAEDVRRFGGATLGLDVDGRYATFSQVDGDATVWVLSAARRDRLEPHTWWWPVIGRVPYQGFFDRKAADRAAMDLARRGLDVDVRPASAFSTLGWFADPLLSTTVKAPPVVMAETILHELFHATLYVPGETTFNESAAMFVGHRGAIAYFCGTARDAARCTEAHARWDALRAHGRILGRYAARLRSLYARGERPARREAERAALAAATGRSLVRRRVGEADDVVPPNNARLLSMLAYETELDGFDRLAASSDALPAAIAGLVRGARDAADPFAVVRDAERRAARYGAIEERGASPTERDAAAEGVAAGRLRRRARG